MRHETRSRKNRCFLGIPLAVVEQDLIRIVTVVHGTLRLTILRLPWLPPSGHVLNNDRVVAVTGQRSEWNLAEPLVLKAGDRLELG